jgi:hypothetical protein
MVTYRIVSVEALPGFVLRLQFADGTRGSVCVKDDLDGPVFEPLRDEREFAKVRVDEFGAVSWPNGADMAPDALYADVRGASVSAGVAGASRGQS